MVAAKAELIAEKKSIIKHTDAIMMTPELFTVKGGKVTKAVAGEVSNDANSVRVKVVANTANFCDSHMDVLLADCWAKSIKERKGMIPHLHDHIHRLDAKVGDVVNIYSQEMSLSELGINKTGSTQSLIFETDIKREYNEHIFKQYKAGRINQHSIGLQYVKLGLAVNDEESTAEYELWNKYIDQVINKEYVESKGFFWVVPEIKLFENSAVLFGSNSLTPTLDVKTTDIEPFDDTQNQPKTGKKLGFDKIMQTLKNN